ncbi:hypothetical protein [Streptomyces sp. NPDC060194]|uniref:hypothetical protein n=1 Tax=Streptomyces sp. NPDC060194 TaxID=3347069 RepID=UPI00365706D4
MRIRVEAAWRDAEGTPWVRVRTEAGVATAKWCGEPTAAGNEHHVEWTVDEDAVWGVNAHVVEDARSALTEDGERLVFRGRLQLDHDGVFTLSVGDWLVMFDGGTPPPGLADGECVEVSADRTSATLYPYLL